MSTLAAVLEQLGGAWTWPFDSGTDAGPRGQIITAFAGAFAGAYGAQWISERNKRHTDVAKELRETNAAVALAATNCNVLINLKKQHVRDLKQRYDEEKAQFLAYFELTAQNGHMCPRRLRNWTFKLCAYRASRLMKCARRSSKRFPPQTGRCF